MGLKLKFEKLFIKDNTDRVKKTESEIIQQADEIALKVSQESYNGNVIASLINQTSTTIKLKARNIEFEGLVTANSNFKILTDGSIEAVNAKLSGSITATRMISPQNSRYYGEVGVTGGLVGLGLYNTNRASSPYFRVVEELLGNSFNGFKLLDDGGNIRLRAVGDNTFIYGKSNSDYISVGNGVINLVVNNRVVKQYT